MQYFPAIVVVGYNRPHSLKRLLGSLQTASYPVNGQVDIVISLDLCSDKLISHDILTIVDSFKWINGDKKIINRSEKLGLKKHILKCGDLTEKFDSIILLEDDLFVSPDYYSFACQALKFYHQIDTIAGISLYTHRTNPYLRKPFYPIEDGTDVFFLEFASSWGQVWSRKQWQQFKSWFSEDINVSINDPLPDSVIAWPDSSWLKIFIKYMVEEKKLFVYPRVSLTTNFGDSGTNFPKQDSFYQVSIQSGRKKYSFATLADSLAIYDVFFEITPQVLNHLTDLFSDKEYTVDLYGEKDLTKITCEYILTTEECNDPIITFGFRMKQPLLNVIYDITGDEISFSRVNQILNDNNSSNYEKTISGKNLGKSISISKKIRHKIANNLKFIAQIIYPT